MGATGFEAAYAEGMLEELLPLPAPAEGARDLADAPIALGGQVITPHGARRGWVRIEHGLITSITSRKPRDARPLVTDGVILPGLVDLHGHPEFNVFAAWEPPRTYVNRYAWRGSDLYRQLVREPQDRLLAAVPSGTQLRYAEIRAVVGGVTAIQGASLSTQGKAESMVRNVDGPLLGEHRARAMVDLPSSLTSRGGPQLARALAGVATGQVTALYVHLAEGQRDNLRSQEELSHLVELGALTSATVVIHGTALSRDQLGQVADAGGRLVWSPQSNLRLYGETTRAADALDVGLPMALGADWLPSGSASLLAELRVARQELVEQGHRLSAQELVTMVTAGAADVAGLGHLLGRLETGRVADVAVLARVHDDPYESVCASGPGEVELVLIGGDLVYGRRDWVTHLAGAALDPGIEPVVAWGRRMLLDTGYGLRPGTPAPRLAELRDRLVAGYPPVGPIWA